MRLPGRNRGRASLSSAVARTRVFAAPSFFAVARGIPLSERAATLIIFGSSAARGSPLSERRMICASLFPLAMQPSLRFSLTGRLMQPLLRFSLTGRLVCFPILHLCRRPLLLMPEAFVAPFRVQAVRSVRSARCVRSVGSMRFVKSVKSAKSVEDPHKPC